MHDFKPLARAVRRNFPVFVLLASVLLFSGLASAQTGITLGSSSQSVVFRATGGSTVTMQMGSCVFHTCTLSGAASGTGVSGFYKIVTTGSMWLTQTATTALDHIYLVHQTGSTVFSYFNGATTFLKGNLQLLTLFQSPGSSSGAYNANGTANLTITGGTLASLFGSAPSMMINIQFETLSHTIPMDLTRLFGPGTCTGRCLQTSAVLLNGDVSPSPEPTSLLLVGSGLTGLMAYWRRRRTV